MVKCTSSYIRFQPLGFEFIVPNSYAPKSTFLLFIKTPLITYAFPTTKIYNKYYFKTFQTPHIHFSFFRKIYKPATNQVSSLLLIKISQTMARPPTKHKNFVQRQEEECLSQRPFLPPQSQNGMSLFCFGESYTLLTPVWRGFLQKQRKEDERVAIKIVFLAHNPRHLLNGPGSFTFCYNPVKSFLIPNHFSSMQLRPLFFFSNSTKIRMKKIRLIDLYLFFFLLLQRFI